MHLMLINFHWCTYVGLIFHWCSLIFSALRILSGFSIGTRWCQVTKFTIAGNGIGQLLTLASSVHHAKSLSSLMFIDFHWFSVIAGRCIRSSNIIAFKRPCLKRHCLKRPCLKPALSPRRRQWVGFLPKEKGFLPIQARGATCKKQLWVVCWKSHK